MTLRRRPTVHALLVALLATFALAPLAAAPASAAVPGYVRLAHLSPDTPEVDVWVTSFRGSKYSKVLPGVSYGTLSEYQRLSPGSYTVAMREPGAAGTTAPLIRTSLRVVAGKAYTVAGLGRNADLSLKVLTDDLGRPSAGKARMRVVQASSTAPVVDVSTSDGQSIALGVRFPSTTPYSEINAQEWTLRAQPQEQGVEPAEETVQVEEGAIYTALVLDEGDTGVQLVVRADASGAASSPVGSVATGLGGGAAGSDAGGSPPWTVLAGVAVAFLLAVLASVSTRRRARA